MEEIAPVMARAGRGGGGCQFLPALGLRHGRDPRRRWRTGGARGASTISQQVVKNVFLWQGRSWPRKALEAVMTPVVEAVWSKRRILEVYLNVAEFGEGVFGVEAAARHYFGVAAADLTRDAGGAAGGDPARPRRTASAADPTAVPAPPGGPDRATARRRSRADGRAACFES